MTETETIVVAMFGRAEGNETVGTAWTETAVFTPDTPLKEVLAWSQRLDGKSAPHGTLTIRYADDQRPKKYDPMTESDEEECR